MLVIMAGLPASGKSTLAQALAWRTRGVVLDKDAIRHALFAPEDIEYTAAQDDFVMDLMLQTARYLLEKSPERIVFLDGRTFSQTYHRQCAMKLAETLRTPWRIIECVCSESSARARLETDESEGRHPAANRSFDLWQRVRASFEPIAAPKAVIDTDRPFEECVSQGMRAIGK